MVRLAFLCVCLFAVFRWSSGCCPLDETRRQGSSNVEVSSNYQKDPCSTPKNVDTFTKNFARAVDKCELLSSIFDGMKNVTRDELHAAAFYTSTCYREQQGFQEPTEDANKATEAIVQNCKKITPGLVRSIYSNAAGKMLNENNKLNGENAAKMGVAYATATKNVAKVYAGENCPRSKAQSIVLGYLNFISDQDLFNPDTTAPSSTIFSNEVRCEDTKAGPPQKNCPIACYSPAKTFLRQSDDVCKISSKAIDIFVSTFRNEVRRCKVLTDLFNIRPDVSPQEMSRGAYYVSLFLLGQNGAKNPRELADFMTRFIKEVKPQKICQLEGIQARFVAKFLETGNQLDTKNAKSQAIKLADAMKKRANLVVDSRWPTSKVIAIQLGWRYFLDLGKLLSKDTAPRMAYLYGNEWRCAAKSYN